LPLLAPLLLLSVRPKLKPPDFGRALVEALALPSPGGSGPAAPEVSDVPPRKKLSSDGRFCGENVEKSPSSLTLALGPPLPDEHAPDHQPA
jgi:hypothetical protein